MPLEHAILAFLSERPRSGYDLKKDFDRSVGHFWSAAQSHIYKALDELERKGWATVQLIPQQVRPNRKEFHITEAGRGELTRWLTSPLPPAPVREPWLIQLYFSQSNTDAEIAALIRARIQAVSEALAALAGNHAQAEGLRARFVETGLARTFDLRLLTLEYGINYYENELAWLEKALERVQTLPPLQ